MDIYLLISIFLKLVTKNDQKASGPFVLAILYETLKTVLISNNNFYGLSEVIKIEKGRPNNF